LIDVRTPRNYVIWVSEHARTRARERFPGYKAARITDEVRFAIDAGRISRHPPPGVKDMVAAPCLFAWTPDGERVFILTVNKWDGGESFAVKTVIRATKEAA
jgi:hypothetical protein